MNKSELSIGVELIEKKPSKHTDKLHIIIIKGEYKGYDSYKKRMYTYYTCQTKEGSYYPCANTDNLKGGWLDGLIGTYNLSTLKKEYRINSNDKYIQPITGLQP